MFRCQFDPHDRVFQEVGCPVQPTYSAKYDTDGVLDLVQTGEVNLYDQIQSHRDSVDIHVLMQRFEAGDVDCLSQAQGIYADVSGMPTTYAEVLNAVIQGQQTFDQLPLDVRAKFGHSFSEWLSAMDKPDFAERMGYSVDSGDVLCDANNNIEEVVANES